jgi:geranylgeranyl diphosphate synthase, type II
MLYNFEQLQQKVEAAILHLDFENRKPEGLYAPVGYILSIGGKRIRPVMLLMACNLFSDELDHAVIPSVGLEIFHNFTLLHDDIMDDAAIRRNHPTVHIKWNENTAILSGDAMSVLAYEYLMTTSPELFSKTLPVFSRAAIEVCEGQQLDVDFESQFSVSEQEYLKMIELKTSVLLAASFQIGALLGGANDQEAQNLYDAGLNLGLAFQVQDDLLDTYGDQSKFGKTIGGDILLNKKTFLMVKALEVSGREDKKLLNDIIGAKDFDPTEKIRQVKEIYDRSGVKDLAEQKIRYYSDKAFGCFEKIGVSSDRKIMITKMASALMSRSF